MKSASEREEVPAGYAAAPAKVLKVKEFLEDDRPQERAMKFGCQTLSVADLLALIIRSGLPGLPITEITRTLMRENKGSLHQLERVSHPELLRFNGLGEVKALQIEALFELIRRYNDEEIEERPLIKAPEDIYNLMKGKIGNLPHEEIWAIYLNRKNEVTSYRRITQGTATASVFDSKQIVKEALLNNAEALALCHNHPSGNLRPSVQDDSITKRLAEACRTLDIRMIDHLIVTVKGYYSYSEQGRL